MKIYSRKLSFLIILTIILSIFLQSAVSAAPAKKYDITVTVTAIQLLSNNHVGENWNTYVQFKKTNLVNGSIKTAVMKSTEKISITFKAIETDKKPDIGTTVYNTKVSSLKNGTTTVTKNVTVKENGGKYSGKKAVWKFTVTITKALKK